MFTQFNGLFWFVAFLVPLVLLQRLLHREIQAVILILTRNPRLTMAVFSLLFFPGVFLHELSHFIMAKFLRVRTGGFSLIPEAMPDGRLMMGYVETERADVVRDSLIGLAPLIAGSLFVAYSAINRLKLLFLWDLFFNGQMNLFWAGIQALPHVKDFALWFYLTFAVSSTMTPSPSDRHAWMPLGIGVAVLFIMAILAGAGPFMIAYLAPPLDDFLGSVATVFGLSITVNGVLVLPVALIHKLLARMTGVDVKRG